MKTLTRKLKISHVWIEHKVDEHPDLSWLGAYHNRLDALSTPFTVDRFASLNADRNTMRYFTPASSVSQDAQADYARMEAYNAGQWHMIGIIAKAEIISPQGIIQTLHSGGLWDIESDSGAEYFESIAQEQLGELHAELLALGIGERAIGYAFKKVEDER